MQSLSVSTRHFANNKQILTKTRRRPTGNNRSYTVCLEY